MSTLPEAQVAIITRTRERPLLLRRACQSVLGQSYSDWIHLIVNDGGDPQTVEDVVQTFHPQYQGRVHILHNPRNVGMEAASNLGIKGSHSRWITIHDDDDSWEPDFLQKTCAHLKHQTGSARTQGVVTQTTRIVEEIIEDTIHPIEIHPFNPDLSVISLLRIAEENTFPPISFLFERKHALSVGLFNESLPVLGDWEFNLRFLLQADIEVIPEALACYHHRKPSASTPSYSNTITGTDLRHREVEQQLIAHWAKKTTALHAGLYALTQEARKAFLLRRENQHLDSANMALREETSLYQINAL